MHAVVVDCQNVWRVESNRNMNNTEQLGCSSSLPPKHMKEHWTQVFIFEENMNNTEQLGVLSF